MRKRNAKKYEKKLFFVLLIIIIALIFVRVFSFNERKPIIINDYPVVAIVLDDLGDDRAVLEPFLKMEYPLTFAVMPQQRYSHEITEDIWHSGKEVILHMPMEPERQELINDYNVKLVKGMSEAEIIGFMDYALAEVDLAVGINNHMGSLFTKQKKEMRHLFNYLKSNNLFFLDSKTTRDSIGKELAKEIGLAYLSRDVFLDSEPNELAIKEQIKRLKELAIKQGRAIAIGHINRPETVRVLIEELPKFLDDGIGLVFLSDLL